MWSSFSNNKFALYVTEWLNHLSKPLLDDLSSRPAAWNWCSHPKLWLWCRCSQWPTFSHCCRRSGPGLHHRVLEMWSGTSSFSCPTLWPFYPSTMRRLTSNRSCKCSSIIRIDDRLTRICDWKKVSRELKWQGNKKYIWSI